MFTFSAVIYNGNKQILIRHDCKTDTEFSDYLESQYGCHVCLWSNKELSESTLANIAAAKRVQ
ncbi:hypothetical protein CW735_06520 [Alteromonas sp. MB-3u-76]|uniref:hypothetical protein n=1 Tax=Alteromonas sp. MB-3u-76 TaxID=2058133 RepID=UPI000C31862D|nr:hypothetical protein [Alteromonas sp. MB-3u-76]AUC87882.1 hypothetical protein CW735_06520 [Alteromonas sp. MB-3u-76]